jgi:hypothetical protein
MASANPNARILTIDVDALELLKEMCPVIREQGPFISGLLREEKRVREERQRLRRVLEEADTVRSTT